ncbi:hypothetical protein SAMN06265347_10460 [Halobellus salinus]|nr:hypothetical protein SAMN06265347_10460 [Halobellus salinus]
MIQERCLDTLLRLRVFTRKYLLFAYLPNHAAEHY